MKKNNLFNLVFSYVLVVGIVTMACTKTGIWDVKISDAKKDFTKVLTKEIVEKTINDFLADRYYHSTLQELNWVARENFLQANSPWEMPEYRKIAYATFTAWDGEEPINNYSLYYFQDAKVDTIIARPFLNFRRAIIEIAKEYLANENNLTALYTIYKPMLVEKCKGKKEMIENTRTSITIFLSGRGEQLKKYDLEFLQRRQAEGGDKIISTYLALIDDLLLSI